MVSLILILPALGYAQSNLDSLYLRVKETKDEQKADAMIELARGFQTISADSVEKYGYAAKQLSKIITYKKGEIEALFVLGLAKRMVSQYDSSLLFFKDAFEKADDEDFEELLSEINMGIGGVYHYQNIPDSALLYFTNAAEGFEKLGSKKRLAAAYSNLGMIMSVNESEDKALYYYHQALRLAEELQLLNSELPTLINLAVLFEHKEDYDSALYYADKCYSLSKENNMTYGVARSLLVLSNVYSQMELFDLGLKSAEEGIVLFESMNDMPRVENMMYKKSIALSGLDRKEEALLICQELIDQIEEGRTIKENVYLLASNLSQELNRPDQALKYHQLFFESYKNNALETKNELITELEAKYDTDKKSREISSLNDKNQIQELRLKQQNILIIGAVVMFVIVILVVILFNRQSRLRKQNEMLSLEQRFLRSQMNPHFIFNALGAIQKFVIKNDPMQSAVFISKFSSLMRQVLEHSREEFVTLNEEIETLENYLDLQQLRFNNNFDYAIEVDQSIDPEELMMPPMFAQPFIENALEHGITELDHRGKITIKFERQNDRIKLIITDNGKGLDDTTINAESHTSLATTITKERIERINGLGQFAEFKLENLKSDIGETTGVMISLLLPLKYN